MPRKKDRVLKIFKRLLLICLITFSIIQTGFAFTSFVVRRIEVKGLQRVSKNTVLNYLPVHIGEQFGDKQSVSVIDALYNTGFFSDVRLQRQGRTLIVVVRERPTIGLLTITGNKSIPAKQLKKALKSLGIVEGLTFDSAKLKAITQGLKQEYDNLGRYAAKINTHVIKEPRNRVAIRIHVIEGPTAIVQSIKITGNKAFSKHTLLKQFSLTTPGLLTFFTNSDRYSETKLNKDLNTLKNFYQDHGYLHFKVVSKKVVMKDQDRKVYISIHISEGPIYHLGGYKVAGEAAYNKKVNNIVKTLKVNQIFSRRDVVRVNKQIQDYYANQGYAFPNIQAMPRVNEVKHTVFLTFRVKRGKTIYVHRINFVGNSRTEDQVLRSRLTQMEGSVYSLTKVQQSKRKLALLRYIRNVTVTNSPVPGNPNEVNLTYHVHEVNAGRASIMGGYGDVEGFFYGANISEPNFMGTGREVSVGFQRGEYTQSYNFSYNNPFYTTWGMSRGFSVYYTRTNSGKVNNITPYDMDDYGASVNYGVPLSANDTFNFGAGYDHINIHNVDTAIAAPGTTEFLGKYPSPFQQVNLTAGMTRDTRDRAIFPTSGSIQSITTVVGVPAFSSAVSYYKATYTGSWYWPLGHGFIISPHATLGIGGGFGKTGALPFYNNFYAGGIATLPGYSPQSLGPKNPNDGNSSLGGNVETLAGIDFVFPNHISDKVRTAIALNAGNVFQTHHARYTQSQLQTLSPINYESISLKNMRASIGLVVSWYSPLGLIDVSVAKALVKKPGDDPSLIGFTFGTNI